MENEQYFIKYLDKRFEELGNKIDTLSSTTAKDVTELKNRMDRIEKEQKWASQKIWVATGGFLIITFVAVYFLATFKQLNEFQVQKAVSQALLNFNPK